MEEKEDNRILAYTLGVDVGQSQDYTALVVIEAEIGRIVRHDHWGSPRITFEDERYTKDEVIYRVPDFTRLPLQTPYPKQVKMVSETFNRLPVHGKGFEEDNRVADTTLALDRTGCGRPVVDLFEQAGLKPVGVTITGGDQVIEDGDHYRVPKRELVNLVKVLLQTDRLIINKSLPKYDVIKGELENFRYKINDNANDVYGAVSGTHDDILLAMAVGLWVSQRRLGYGWGTLDPAIQWELQNMTGSGWYEQNPYS